ncbi:hypothetical protein GE09DRAFT_1122119 [Coniochaeta sp. 2T2.1]|nr:hypothetical protein GE09DRAFT_1122119 [Coniochaeta sp. 2T2.1]
MVYRPETASWPVRILSRFSYDPATQFALLLLRPEHLYLATDVYVRCRLPPMPVPQYMCHDIRAALGSRHQANLDGLETRDMQIAFRPTHLRARQAGLRGAGQETYGISDHDLDFKVGIIFKLSSSISASPLTSGAKNILALERDLGSGWFLSILPITSKRHDITLWIGFAASDIKYERGAFRRHCFGRCLGSTPWLREYESELIGDYKQKMVQEVTFRERTALEPANPSPDHRFHVAVDVGESFSAGPHCDLALAHIVITDL